MEIDLEVLGRWLIVAGVALVVIGAALMVVKRLGGLGQFPGTLRWQVGNLTCVAPLLLSLLISVVLTIILNLILRGMNK
ncbi:MAG: DUF2905 domain-containing protein [Anaerolineae bacterium]|nr:DUF2905 domain-containing protein [Anaerolineae bacterium]